MTSWQEPPVHLALTKDSGIGYLLLLLSLIFWQNKPLEADDSVQSLYWVLWGGIMLNSYDRHSKYYPQEIGFGFIALKKNI